MILLFNSAISGFIYDRKISNYIERYDSTTIFYSETVENNISANDSEQFIKFISDLKSIDGVQDVGYTIEESSIIKNNDNAIIKTV